jgi:hypothetical protein
MTVHPFHECRAVSRRRPLPMTMTSNCLLMGLSGRAARATGLSWTGRSCCRASRVVVDDVIALYEATPP